MGFSDSVLENCDSPDSTQKLDLHILAWMLRLMKEGFIWYLLAIITMSLARSGFDTITAYLLKDIIARVSGNSTGEMLEGMAAELLLCFGVGIILLVVYALAFYVYTMEAKKGGANLQRLMYSKCMRLPYSYYENNHSGEFMSKVIYDCERAQGIYGSRFRRILMPFLMTVFFLIPMFLLNWQVTLCLFLTSVALFIINGLFIGPMQKMSSQMSGTNVGITEQISNILSGIEQIKIFGLKSLMVDQYMEENEKFRKQQNRMNRMSACLDGLNRGFELMGSMVFIALGLFFVSRNITTVDCLAAIYVLYGIMSWNLLQVGLYIPSMASYLANARRVYEFLKLPEEEEHQSLVKTGRSIESDIAVSLKNVCFAYNDGQDILKDFSMDIPRGKCVALKGESGKGKSTVAKLLLGLYPVNSGEMYLDGQEYRDLSLSQIRDRIGYVPQEPYLYDVSIAENISYGRPGASREEIIQAAKMANAHEFILQLEDGYETMAGERGNRLSGGQKQRIAIARAILKNAPILILDEATSALDNRSEQLVNEALERLMQGRTTILIAHRQSTLAHADMVIEM